MEVSRFLHFLECRKSDDYYVGISATVKSRILGAKIAHARWLDLNHLVPWRLEQEPWIEVCAVASGIEEPRELIELHLPHVLVINVQRS